MTASGSPADVSARGARRRDLGAEDTGVLATLLAIAALLVIWILATVPWWRDGLVIPWDARNHFYPMLRWLANELWAGRLPDFMAEVYAGRPSLPDPQSMVTSPGFLLVAAADPAPSMLAMDMLVLTELLLGGSALILLGRLFGVHPLACLLGALVFVLGGAPMARLQHVLLVQSYAFIPVALVAFAWAARRPTVWRGLLAGLAAGLLAVGRDHVALLSLYVVAGFAFFLLLRQPAPLGFLRRALPAIVVGAVVAAAIAAPPIAASALTAAESNRPGFSLLISGSGGMCPPCLLTLGFPDLYENLRTSGDFWGPGAREFLWPNSTDMATVQYFAGVAPLVLVAVYLVTVRGWPPLQWFGLAVALGALIYGMGNWTAVFSLIHAYLPGADLFRRASDASYVFNLGLSLLVVCAAGRYAAHGLPAASPVRTTLLLFAAAAAVAAAFAVAALHDRTAEALDDVALALAIAGVAVAILYWGTLGGRIRRLAALGGIVALTAADLSIHSAGTWLNAQPPGLWQIQEDPLGFPAARALHEAVADAQSREGPVRVEIRGLGGAGQNLSLVLGVDNISGYNPLRPAAFDRATGSGPNSHLPKRRFGEQMTSYRSPLADLLGLRFLLLGAPVEDVDPASAGAFGEPRRVGGAYLYENERALPRAILVRADRTRPFDPALADGAGPLPSMDWKTSALVGLSGDPSEPLPDGPAPSAGTLEIVEHAPGRLVARIDPAAEGFVILHELRTAGWTARVDGERRALLPANGLFQAVPVAPGDRTVVFAYSSLGALGLAP